MIKNKNKIKQKENNSRWKHEFKSKKNVNVSNEILLKPSKVKNYGHLQIFRKALLFYYLTFEDYAGSDSKKENVTEIHI